MAIDIRFNKPAVTVYGSAMSAILENGDIVGSYSIFRDNGSHTCYRVVVSYRKQERSFTDLNTAMRFVYHLAVAKYLGYGQVVMVSRDFDEVELKTPNPYKWTFDTAEKLITNVHELTS